MARWTTIWVILSQSTKWHILGTFAKHGIIQNPYGLFFWNLVPCSKTTRESEFNLQGQWNHLWDPSLATHQQVAERLLILQENSLTVGLIWPSSSYCWCGSRHLVLLKSYNQPRSTWTKNTHWAWIQCEKFQSSPPPTEKCPNSGDSCKLRRLSHASSTVVAGTNRTGIHYWRQITPQHGSICRVCFCPSSTVELPKSNRWRASKTCHHCASQNKWNQTSPPHLLLKR